MQDDNVSELLTSGRHQKVPGDNVGNEVLVHAHRHILQEEASKEDVHGRGSHCEVRLHGVVLLAAAHICCRIGHCCEG